MAGYAPYYTAQHAAIFNSEPLGGALHEALRIGCPAGNAQQHVLRANVCGHKLHSTCELHTRAREIVRGQSKFAVTGGSSRGRSNAVAHVHRRFGLAPHSPISLSDVPERLATPRVQ